VDSLRVKKAEKAERLRKRGPKIGNSGYLLRMTNR
jgi:hypothetical protein